jgi:hypothetical protein
MGTAAANYHCVESVTHLCVGSVILRNVVARCIDVTKLNADRKIASLLQISVSLPFYNLL